MYPAKIPDHPISFYSEETEFSKDSKDILAVSIHKDCKVGMHYHSFYEINVVVSGTGCHYIGDMAIPLVSGEVFVIPPNVRHGYYCEKGLSVCHILLNNRFMKLYGKQLATIPGYSALFEVEPYLRQVYDNNPTIRLDETRFAEFKRDMNLIMNTSGDEYVLYRAIHVLRFLADMCCYTKLYKADLPTDDKSREIFAVLEYIQENYSEHITLEKLMQIAKMSRPTLHRHFKEVTKTTPLEYIIKCRVTAAQNLLAQGKLTRTEIAQRCGFFDTAHMNKHLNKGNIKKS